MPPDQRAVFANSSYTWRKEGTAGTEGDTGLRVFICIKILGFWEDKERERLCHPISGQCQPTLHTPDKQ